MRKTGIIILSSLFLAACSPNYYTTNGEKQYLKSRNGLRLVVPKPLTESNISHFYDLPTPGQNTEVSTEPPTVS